MRHGRPLSVSEIEVLREKLDYCQSSGIFRWRIKSNYNIQIGDRAGCLDKFGYVVILYRGRQYFGHRLAFAFTHGFDAEYIDHINGVRNDNRIMNLRKANAKVNSLNRINTENMGIKKIGSGKYIALLRYEGKQRYFGVFPTKAEAKQAYLNKKSELLSAALGELN